VLQLLGAADDVPGGHDGRVVMNEESGTKELRLLAIGLRVVRKAEDGSNRPTKIWHASKRTRDVWAFAQPSITVPLQPGVRPRQCSATSKGSGTSSSTAGNTTANATNTTRNSTHGNNASPDTRPLPQAPSDQRPDDNGSADRPQRVDGMLSVVPETHFDEWIASHFDVLWPELLDPSLLDRAVDVLRTKPGAREIDVTLGDFATAEVGERFQLVYLPTGTADRSRARAGVTSRSGGSRSERREQRRRPGGRCRRGVSTCRIGRVFGRARSRQSVWPWALSVGGSCASPDGADPSVARWTVLFHQHLLFGVAT
jgi:hypothetical protein